MMRARLIAVVVGMALAVIGLATNDRRVIWAAIAALIVALVLRLLARRRQT